MTPVSIPDVPVVTPAVVTDVTSVSTDMRFQRDVMLKCLDDMCNLEYYMVDDAPGEVPTITLPKNIDYMDTHAEFITDDGEITNLDVEYTACPATNNPFNTLTVSDGMLEPLEPIIEALS